MKKLLWLFILVPVISFAQQGGEKNFEGFLKQELDSGATPVYVQIFNKSFAGGVTDTTEPLDVSQYKTHLVTLMAKDSSVFLIKYQLSVDKTNWSTIATKDSLTQAADGVTVKSVDFTSTTLGAKYVRFIFATSTLAHALGTTTPKYWAYILLRKY